MKKKLALLLAAVMLCAAIVGLAEAVRTVEALISQKKIIVNGVQVRFADEAGQQLLPVLEYAGEVYVPVSGFADATGMTISKQEDSIALTLGQAEPTATPRPEKVRVDITAANFKTYFVCELSVRNVRDTTERTKFNGYTLNFNEVTADFVFTCYPRYPMEIYNVRFSASRNFESWVKDVYEWSSCSFSATLPTDGRVTLTDSKRSYEIRYSLNVKESSNWFGYFGTAPTINSASGYIMVDASVAP